MASTRITLNSIPQVVKTMTASNLESKHDSLSTITRSMLMELPRELRDKIYECLGANLTSQDVDFDGAKVNCRHVFNYVDGKIHFIDPVKPHTTGENTSWPALFAFLGVNRQLNAEITSLVSERAVLCFDMDEDVLHSISNKDSRREDGTLARNLPTSFVPNLVKYNIRTVVLRPDQGRKGAPHAMDTYRYTLKGLVAFPNVISRLILVPALPHPALQHRQRIKIWRGRPVPESLSLETFMEVVWGFEQLEVLEVAHKNNLYFKKDIKELVSVVKDRELAYQVENVYNPWYDQQYVLGFDADDSDGYITNRIDRGQALRKGIDMLAAVMASH